MKIKMTNANTADNATLKIGSETAKPLWYNDERASSSNTWEPGEVISVYFDGTNYHASNAQGGGGKAEKISYDNSQSGLVADNVQEGLDEIQENSTIIKILDKDSIFTGSCRIISTMKWGKSTDSHYFIPCSPGDKFRLTGSSDVNYAFVQKYTVVSNATIYPSSIYLNTPILHADEIIVIEAPEDACGLVINKLVNGSDLSPSLIEQLEIIKTKDLKKEVEDNIKTYTDIPISSINFYAYRLTSAKKWTNTSSKTEAHYWIPCNAGDTFKLTAAVNQNFNYAFLKSHNNTGPIAADVSSVYDEINCPVCYNAQTVTIICPEDATGLAINKVVNGTETNINKIEVVTTIKEDVDNLSEDIRTVDAKTQVLGRVRDAVCIGQGGINVNTGGIITSSVQGYTGYIPTCGAQYLLLHAPAMNSSNHGIAFYQREYQNSYISGIPFSERNEGSLDNTGYVWKLVTVPDGATCFRMSTWGNTDTQYRIVVETDYLLEVFRTSVANSLATQIFRAAKTISPRNYLYAFGISQQVIIGDKAYVSYAGSTTNLDDDSLNNNNIPTVSVVDLFDLSVEVHTITYGVHHYADGSVATPKAIQYETRCATPDGKVASFALMRFNNKNPYYSYCISNPGSYEKSFTGCILKYIYEGSEKTVDFTANNYRQMLADLGYVTSYKASTADGIDNINIHYDQSIGYYAVFCAPQGSNQPIILIHSEDMATWSPIASFGISAQAGEISAIYKEGVVYVCYRNNNGGMKYLIYDVDNLTLLKHELLSPCSLSGNTNELLSKPDTFMFDNEVYIAINVAPSIYGKISNVYSYKHDGRSQIAIYKIVNNTPILFRTVCNPTGLQYFSFMETPPMYDTQHSTGPIFAQGAIYCAFSEDKRHLYRRQIAQVSFADVTALFADFGRIV